MVLVNSKITVLTVRWPSHWLHTRLLGGVSFPHLPEAQTDSHLPAVLGLSVCRTWCQMWSDCWSLGIPQALAHQVVVRVRKTESNGKGQSSTNSNHKQGCTEQTIWGCTEQLEATAKSCKTHNLQELQGEHRLAILSPMEGGLKERRPPSIGERRRTCHRYLAGLRSFLKQGIWYMCLYTL